MLLSNEISWISAKEKSPITCLVGKFGTSMLVFSTSSVEGGRGMVMYSDQTTSWASFIAVNTSASIESGER